MHAMVWIRFGRAEERHCCAINPCCSCALLTLLPAWPASKRRRRMTAHGRPSASSADAPRLVDPTLLRILARLLACWVAGLHQTLGTCIHSTRGRRGGRRGAEMRTAHIQGSTRVALRARTSLTFACRFHSLHQPTDSWQLGPSTAEQSTVSVRSRRRGVGDPGIPVGPGGVPSAPVAAGSDHAQHEA